MLSMINFLRSGRFVLLIYALPCFELLSLRSHFLKSSKESSLLFGHKFIEHSYHSQVGYRSNNINTFLVGDSHDSDLSTDATMYPFVILPGFGNDATDYSNPLGMGSEISIQQNLLNCGIKSVEIVPIVRNDWLKIISGVFTIDFWKSQCKPTTLFGFYCKAVDAKVRQIYRDTGKPVVLVGHSAGGWLARALLANGTWAEPNQNSSSADLNLDYIESSKLVMGLITLGSPHYPPQEGFPDMTRGALQYVSRNFPGAFLYNSPHNIFYMTVAGTAVKGNHTAEKGTTTKFASDSYLQVTGDRNNMGNELGDGIVPLKSAHLDDALQITLSNAWHSIQAPENMWYGGNMLIINQWLPQALKLIEETAMTRQRSIKEILVEK